MEAVQQEVKNAPMRYTKKTIEEEEKEIEELEAQRNPTEEVEESDENLDAEMPELYPNLLHQ